MIPKRAMILAAGRGTRLRPITDHTPKPLLQVQGKPLIEWQLQALARAGVTEVIINLHHLGEQIEAYLGDGSQLGLTLSYSHEIELLETGGGIAHALPFFQDEPFILTNGDIWTDFDFADLPSSVDPKQAGHRAHIVLTPTPDYRDAGDFEYASGRVTARGEDFVYCGIAVLEPGLFQQWRDTHGSNNFSFRDIMFALIDENRLGAQLHHGRWLDIGTPEQYAEVR